MWDKKTSGLVVSCFFLVMGVLFIKFRQDLLGKEEARENNRTVGLLNSWDQIKTMTDRENLSIVDVLGQLRSVPVGFLAASRDLLPVEEDLVRRMGFRILWRARQRDQISVVPLLDRLAVGDGLLATGEVALGYPLQLKEVADKIRAVNGFFPVMEFVHQAGSKQLAGTILPYAIKAHTLQSKEMMVVQSTLWIHRLMRAVQERGVRLLFVQWNPVFKAVDYARFQKSVSRELIKQGFRVGWPERVAPWGKSEKFHVKSRLYLALVMALLSPVMGLVVLTLFDGRRPVFCYLAVCLLAMVAGTVVQALGAIPSSVLGIDSARAVKVQLILPLFLGLLIIFPKEEWALFLNSSVKWNHLLIFGVGLVGLVGCYLMRSGNFPLLPVSNAERHLRDGMEVVFGVRPRFKEFMIGHPLLINGLLLWNERKGASPTRRIRLFILFGLIGQISIVNTFLHFHAPLSLCFLRSFHGVWLGFLIGIFVWGVVHRSERWRRRLL